MCNEVCDTHWCFFYRTKHAREAGKIFPTILFLSGHGYFVLRHTIKRQHVDQRGLKGLGANNCGF